MIVPRVGACSHTGAATELMAYRWVDHTAELELHVDADTEIGVFEDAPAALFSSSEPTPTLKSSPRNGMSGVAVASAVLKDRVQKGWACVAAGGGDAGR